MELRYVVPELSKLDQAGTEVLMLGLFSDERPPAGVAGLVDWRSAGRLSRVLLGGFATGDLGEVLMLPGKPNLPFDKVILFGAGKKSELDDGVFAALIERMLKTAEGLRTRTLVAELPGRHADAIPAERAAGILLEAAQGKPEHDVWTLVEGAAAQKAIGKYLQEQRRRARWE
jgi:cytosol aminopeptidase family protein